MCSPNQLQSRLRQPPALRSEVQRAIRDTANRKSTGPCDVPVKLFKAEGDTVVDKLHQICLGLWETGDWPEDWTESVFIPLLKKGDLKQCSNYRTIALVSHDSKILLRIISERIRAKTETEIPEEQAGFRKGRGTRDQILNLRILMQKARDHQQQLYMCSVDFRKAFDSVPHDKLWLVMLDTARRTVVTEILQKSTCKS